MISEETKAYYDLKKRNDVRESAKRIRRQFLRYKDAEITEAAQSITLLPVEINGVVFKNTRAEIYWLDGDSYKVNIFKKKEQ